MRYFAEYEKKLFRSTHTHIMPVRRSQHQGGLGPFAQQLAMFSLAPIVIDLASNVIGGLLPGLTGGQRGSGMFNLPGNLQMIGLPNHLPPSTYLRVLQPRQKGRGLIKKRKKARHPLQKGGIGPLALVGWPSRRCYSNRY